MDHDHELSAVLEDPDEGPLWRYLVRTWPWIAECGGYPTAVGPALDRPRRLFDTLHPKWVAAGIHRRRILVLEQLNE
ncbi:MAG: hypothetical protein ACP5QO_17615 [Clostridia bacterium]